MKILLISPQDPKNPGELKNLMGGENTYTRLLLKYQPPKVHFIYFEEALRRKLISYHPLQNFFLLLQKFRLLPLGPRVRALVIKHKFDCIYAHGYPVKLSGEASPLVMSDSSSNIVFLEKYLKWPAWRIQITESIKKIIFKTFGVIDGEVNTKKAAGFFVFSSWATRIKRSEFGIKNCRVIYPGLPVPTINSRPARQDSYNKKSLVNLLFVGVWFERKGGRIVLEAFRRLTKRFSNLHLTILGQLPSDILTIKEKNIMQKDFVTYKELLYYYRTHDILVHVPPEVEGYGMAVPEAMSYGMIPVVSNICALPEFVDEGKSGLIVEAGSEAALEMALERLIRDTKLRRILSRGARKRFREQFSLPKFQRQLLRVFHEAVKK